MLQRLFLAAALASLTSCSLTPPEPDGSARRFTKEEADATDLIIRFYGWKSIQIIRPDTREGPFLPLFDREGAVTKLSQLRMRQNLAVVVLGSMFSKTEEQEIIRQWHQIVGARGFQRLVLLRAGFKDDIHGLRVVYDSAMNRADAPTALVPVADGVAQIATATGADAAHPSDASVR